MTLFQPATSPEFEGKHREIAIRYAYQQRESGWRPKATRKDGWLMRRRRELFEAARWRTRNDLEWMPNVEDWAEAFADVVHFLKGDARDVYLHMSDAGIPIDFDTAERAIDKISNSPRPMGGRYCGKLIDLTCEQRRDCGITTMEATDETKEERKAYVAERRRERDRVRKRRERERKPRRVPLSVSRPWEAMGLSRSSWYRRGKPVR